MENVICFYHEHFLTFLLVYKDSIEFWVILYLLFINLNGLPVVLMGISRYMMVLLANMHSFVSSFLTLLWYYFALFLVGVLKAILIMAGGLYFSVCA